MTTEVPIEPLPWTGERLAIGCHRPLVLEHLHRYAIALQLCRGKRVLDIACGEGFGANLLANSASFVLGVDRDGSAVTNAKYQHVKDNLNFCVGTCEEIPCQDASFDIVVSFDTLEHVTNHERFLAEIKRVATPEGLFLISTPEKHEYNKLAASPNPFHQRELDYPELVALLRSSFKQMLLARQRLVVGSWIAPDNASSRVNTWEGTFESVTAHWGVNRGLYSFAACSDSLLPPITFGVLEDYEESSRIWDLLDSYGSCAGLLRHLHATSQGCDDRLTADNRPPDITLSQLEIDLKRVRTQRDHLAAVVLRLLEQLGKKRETELVEKTGDIARIAIA